MVEKKLCVVDLRIKYDGPVDIIDFFRAVEDWIHDKGMHKEIKKKSEEVGSKSKKVEWMIEIWEMPSDYAKRVVRMQALFKDIREVNAVIKGVKRKIQTADVLVLIDGILESDVEARWQQKPTHYFLRAIFDKYVSKFYTERYEDKLTKDTYEFYRYLMKYFNSYNSKDHTIITP